MLKHYLEPEPTMSLNEVLTLLNKSRSWLFEQIKQKKFPEPDRKSGRKYNWRKSTVQNAVGNDDSKFGFPQYQRDLKIDVLTERENIIAFADETQFPSTVHLKNFCEIADVNFELFRQRCLCKFYDLDTHFEQNLKRSQVKINSEAMCLLLKKRRYTDMDIQPIKLGFREDRVIDDNSDTDYLPIEGYIEKVDISTDQIIARLAANEWKIGKHVRLDFQRTLNKKEASIYINLRAVQKWAVSY